MNLIIQPEAGLAPVVKAIQRARKTVDIAIFRIDREEIEKALAAAVQRGVRVRVLVAHTNRGGESRLRKLEQRMLEAGVTVTRTGDEFVRYHAKYMVGRRDAAPVRVQLHVRGYGQEPQLRRLDEGQERGARGADAVRRRLHAPAVRAQQTIAARGQPRDARDTLTAFVKGAKRQLLIYDVNIQDPAFAKLLKQRAAKASMCA